MPKWLLVMVLLFAVGRVWGLEKVAVKGENRTALEGVARFPCWSPDGNWIAFSMYGDLWKVPATGGRAARLTYHKAEDVKPRWSPDGKTLAFSSDRKGNFDVWTVPADGGPATQITYHSVWDSISDWTPDGKWIIFYSYRSGDLELWKINSSGGMAIQVTRDGGRDATVSADGARIVYCRGDASLWQKGYRGSSNWDVYTISLKEEELPRKLTDFPGNDLSPVYTPDGKAIYYVREQDGPGEPVYNLWKMGAGGENPVPVTNFESDLISPHFSADGKKIVFERDFRIWTMNVGEADAVPASIDIALDVSNDQKVSRVISEGGEMGHWSRSGQEIAFALNGDIWIIPAQGGEGRQITRGPALDQWPRFSPDGKSLAYFSNKSGNNEIYLLDLASSKETQLTSHESEDFYHNWSPDGKSLVFTSERSGNRDLWLVSRDGGIAEQLTDSPESEDDASFSPDGKWIAFDSGKSGHQEVWVMPADKGYARAVQVTRKNQLTQVPSWSQDSLWLSYETNDDEAHASLWVISREGGNTMQVAVDASLPCWSPDGKWIMFESSREGMKNLYVIEAPQGVIVGKRIPFLARVEVDLAEERKQVFEEAWQAIDKGFYDPDFHGVDWKKVKEKYQDITSTVQSDLEFYVLLNRMSGELRASHTGVVGQNLKNEVETGYLGWTLGSPAGKKVLQVKEVLKDGPADKVWVRRGDFIFQIGETMVSSDTDIDRVLNNTVGKEVKVFVSPTLNPDDGRYLTLVPVGIGEIQSLQYQECLVERIQTVRRECQGRVVYLHLTEMDVQNLGKFRQIVQKTVDRADGMILDIRNNGGGMIHRELLEILIRKPFVAYQAREQKERRFQPDLYWDKPVVVLINEKSFSDAEVFAYAFKTLGLGKLVGVPTPGGVIGTRDITLGNRMTFRVPRVGYYSLTGENLEGLGVKPDFVVAETPEDRAKHRDPQLLKAAQVIMAEITARSSGQQSPPPKSSPENK